MATVVNVGGTSRSGSTMLHLMLGNAPDAFACGEALNWFRPVKTHHFKIDCPCGQNPCPVWQKLQHVPADQFYAAAFRKLQVNFIIDSSKETSWLVDARRWATAHNLKTINLFVWKEPVDLAYSFWKRGYSPNYWRGQFVTYYRKVISAGLPILSVKYTDLVAQPQQKLAQVCAVVGMPTFEGKVRFWEKTQHHLFGSPGTRKQVEIGASIIQSHSRFSPEFESLVPALQQHIQADTQVQQLQLILENADVSRWVNGGSLEQPFQPKKVYPAWYYRERLKRALAKRFPAKSNPMADEAVSTIPLRQQ